jgi:hypothetical protein
MAYVVLWVFVFKLALSFLYFSTNIGFVLIVNLHAFNHTHNVKKTKDNNKQRTHKFFISKKSCKCKPQICGFIFSKILEMYILRRFAKT